MSSAKNRRRYNLHYLIRKAGYTLNTRQRTLFVKHDKQSEITQTVLRYCKELDIQIQTQL